MSAQTARNRGIPHGVLWGPAARHYYVHGKDNIPFYTIILPALLLANHQAGGPDWHLPDVIAASEYLTLEGRKISTSQNWAIWAKDMLERYQPDAIRYFLIANGPEKRDTDFSWREFIHSVNSELLGGYGNFVHRSLAFIHRYLNGRVPQGVLSDARRSGISSLYRTVGRHIEACRFKDALDILFADVRSANKRFDTEQPWLTRTTDPSACATTLYGCVQLIANFAILLQPFLPFSSQRLIQDLGLSEKWEFQSVPYGKALAEPEPLFQRIDPKALAEELARLSNITN